MKSLLIAFDPASVVLLCRVSLAFYRNNKPAAVIQLLREYHWSL